MKLAYAILATFVVTTKNLKSTEMKRLTLVLIAVVGLLVASCGSHEPCPAFQGDAGQPDVEQNV